MDRCKNCHYLFNWFQLYLSTWRPFKVVKCKKCGHPHQAGIVSTILLTIVCMFIIFIGMQLFPNNANHFLTFVIINTIIITIIIPFCIKMEPQQPKTNQ
jgi:CXXC-20-CXXC protein